MCINKPLTIAVSGRALFDLEAMDNIYKSEGIEEFRKKHHEESRLILQPGPAFYIIKKFLSLLCKKNANNDKTPLVEVILISSQSPNTGLSISKSIKHYELDIERAIFTGGSSVIPYLHAIDCQFFLSRSIEDVQEATNEGFSSACLLDLPENYQNSQEPLRIAFDGDSVIFSDESEILYKKGGILLFNQHENQNADIPLSAGPFKNFIVSLNKIQKQCDNLKIILVTARGLKTYERVARTLNSWNIDIDEGCFLNGLNKTNFLKACKADFFLDDQDCHLISASQIIPCAKVPYKTKIS